MRIRPIHAVLLLALSCRKDGTDTTDTTDTVDTSDDTARCADADLVIGYRDADGDGFGDTDDAAAGCTLPEGFVAQYGDCDDADANVNPDATEACNSGVDDDCNGFADADDPLGATGVTAWYPDLDGDGTGAGAAALACEAPERSANTAGDCDDDDASVYPGAAETDCEDPVDRNCDGSVGYADLDDDGVAACEDCDDEDEHALPGGTEICDGADNDCDGTIDGAGATDATEFFPDTDADGYGDPDGTSSTGCTAPTGTAADATDCDDTDADVHPSAPEDDCTDPVDYNCDGKTGFADADNDGFPACQDCRDDLAAANPDASEACDAANVDEDCNGTADDLDTTATGKTTWYRDQDTDNFGDPAQSQATCDGAPSGYVADKTDCNDAAASVNPGKSEVCDASNVDENCTGTADNADSSALGKLTYYRDQDADTYGTSLTTESACDPSAGYVATSTDCNDGNAGINPGKAEACDASNVDENCNSLADDADTSATGKTTYYRDQDTDTYGLVSNTKLSCEAAPSGYVANSTDCNDTAAAINPSKVEVCDGGSVDENCDGASCGPRVSPTLTSNSGQATSDTYHWNGGGLMAWKAFNQDWSGWPATFCWEGTGGWIQIDQNAPTRVAVYKIRGRDDVLNATPTQWTFAGSNDGSSWTTLDSRSGQTWSTVGEHREFALSTVANYRYYRMTVPNGANSGYSLTCFQEMELFGG